MSSLKPVKQDIVFVSEIASLADGAEIDTDFLDGEGYAGYQMTIVGDSTGLTFRQSLKFQEDSSDVSTVAFPLSSPLPSSTDTTFSVPYRRRYQRIQIQNNTGSPITNVGVEIKGLVTSGQPTVTTLSSDPVEQSQAVLTQSVLIWKDSDGVYRNTNVNTSGALVTANFPIEVLRGKISELSSYGKFGKNPDIDSGNEDIHYGGGNYTGFNATAGEAISFVSDDVNDAGSELSNGTATDGSHQTLADSGATFVSDGVSIGDVVINDTKNVHGIITAITETLATVERWADGGSAEATNTAESGDEYRIATATSTGAAVLKATKILESDKAEYKSEYIILNGTTSVDSSGTDYVRCSRGIVILAGGSDINEGEITANQKTTTANVFFVLGIGLGQTQVMCDTIPANKWLYIDDLSIQMARANGSAGSAEVAFMVRQVGELFQAKINAEISDGSGYESNKTISIPPLSDIKWRCIDVSDANTIISAEANGYLANYTAS